MPCTSPGGQRRRPSSLSLYELARGNDSRPLNPDVPPLRPVRSLHLPGGAVERAVLLDATRRLCWQLARALTARGFHAKALKLTLYAEDGGALEAGQAVKPPTGDETRLSRIAGALLGRLTLKAPIASLAVSVYPLRPWHLSLHQLTLVEAGVPARQTKLETALQLIVHRFGQLAVRVAARLVPPVPVEIDVRLNGAGRPAETMSDAS